MDYANILVSLDLGEATPDRVRLAADLARRFEATLTGVAAHKVPAPMLVHDIYDATQQEEENKEKVRAVLGRVEEVFLRNVGDGIRTDWRCDFAGPITYLVDQARSADLIVVGRRGPDDDDCGELGVPPGPLLMEAGRPVLVVPPRVERLGGARIVVAWKDSPEARRAVSAALGFIRRSDQVFVVTAGDDAQFQGSEDVAAHLARHGASVTIHHLKTAVSDGDELYRFASKHDADLIIMGAYGRSRLREWAFGGVTRHLLQQSPVCCLMCH